jgi:hypothetical protein
MKTEYNLWLLQRFKANAGGKDLLALRTDRTAVACTPSQRIPVAWWTEAFEKNYKNEAEYIFGHGRITSLCWLDGYTITAKVSSSQADIQQPDQQQLDQHYITCISILGWAACECQSFQQVNGACKHLYALRLLIPSLGCPYSFRYPNTEPEAIKIYETLFGTKPVLPPLPPTISDINHLGHISEILEQVAEPCEDTDRIGDSGSDSHSDSSIDSSVSLKSQNIFIIIHKSFLD